MLRKVPGVNLDVWGEETKGSGGAIITNFESLVKDTALSPDEKRAVSI
jgi:hypothetical protein